MHGTAARWRAGCHCAECRHAHSDTKRAWRQARARKRLPVEVWQQLLDAIYSGQPFRVVLRDLGLTPNQVWGLPRRTQFDQLVWQVPVLSLTAQAFLFSIALSHDAARTARVIASVLSLLMTVLSLHLMAKPRQAAMHGRAWSDYRNSIDPKIGLSRFFSQFRGFQVWSWGLAMFGVAALVVLLLTAIRPDLLV